MQASYVDGRSTRLHAVDLALDGADLLVTGEGIALRVPFSRVIVDERLGSAARRLRLPDGGHCEVRDLEALDALLRSAPHRDGRVDRLQRRWQIALVALAGCLVLAYAGYRWGLPRAAAVAARHMPPGVEQALGARTLQLLDAAWLGPSGLPAARRTALEARFRALDLPEGGHPGEVLLFRSARGLEPNAFTLPDGRIVLLDGLVNALDDDRLALAVVAHELGHAQRHHGLQQLLQGSALSAFVLLYVGDVSHLVAAAPTALLQARYSRDLEREADDYGAAVLQRNGLAPALLAEALRKLGATRSGDDAIDYLSSHPATPQRLQRLAEWRPRP